ncbi:hypothetical protein LS70_004990 [Helicobacter sp. MIT 11-5569]|uniref:EexN family lipoprotein n=1 Tax=Helicobacter sp. MIT 11-5569 TaxID=1548151 RepID=UPI00051FB1D0|nr:EexN family lipoprotein [Helicobacter sp. MIT 11-5569]TLD83515.1 hypothetical protein LS70_004990 [Helicobacter sp. MIT 11-5569]
MVKLGFFGVVIASVFSACSSEPKSVEYYSDPKNTKELEVKIQECNKKLLKRNRNEHLDCENAYQANYRKSFKKENFLVH